MSRIYWTHRGSLIVNEVKIEHPKGQMANSPLQILWVFELDIQFTATILQNAIFFTENPLFFTYNLKVSPFHSREIGRFDLGPCRRCRHARGYCYTGRG